METEEPLRQGCSFWCLYLPHHQQSETEAWHRQDRDNKIMDNLIAKNEEKVREYREIILKTKEEYRQRMAKLPFEKKIEILNKLKRRAKFLKKFK